MNQYLQGDDLIAFGVQNATTQQVSSASVLIDAYVKRPEGLLYAPDVNGNPCYMTGMSPESAFTSPNAITPGSNVVVTVNGPLAIVEPGKVLILDRANASVVEPVLVVTVAGNQVTLANVHFSHDAGVLLEGGLVITEEKYMPQDRPITNVAQTPVMRLMAGQGRYGYGRRGRVNIGSMDDFNLLATMSHFGGPPAWESFDVLHAGFDPRSGKVWVPSGVMLAYFSEVRLQYVAGFTYATLPPAVKQACANIISAQAMFPMLNGNIKAFQAGESKAQRFADTMLDSDTKQLLMPYCARVMA
ncbi:MAG: hypothetical protein ACXU85_01790 [Xanthobacteraceae bacterium]